MPSVYTPNATPEDRYGQPVGIAGATKPTLGTSAHIGGAAANRNLVVAGDTCFRPIGEGSIIVDDVHCFSNILILCQGGGAAKPRFDLFEQQKPDYLK